MRMDRERWGGGGGGGAGGGGGGGRETQRTEFLREYW